jgi:hypothetical protein
MEELTTLGFLGFAFFITTVDFGDRPSLIEQASIYARKYCAAIHYSTLQDLHSEKKNAQQTPGELDTTRT